MRIHPSVLVLAAAVVALAAPACKGKSKPTAPAPGPAPAATATPCSSPASFGVTTYTTVSSLAGSGFIHLGRYNLGVNGKVVNLSASPIVAGTPQARMAIYSDNAGEPATLLAQSAVQTLTTTGWVDFDIPDVPVTAGSYWIAIAGTTGMSPRYIATGGTYRWKTAAVFGAFPVTIVPNGSDVYNLLLHADFCPN